MRNVGHLLAILALAMSVYLAARGVIGATLAPRPGPLAAAVVLAVAATLLALLVPADAPPGARPRLPLGAALSTLAASLALPWLASASVEAADRAEPYVTWYVGAVGVLMTIVLVRRRALVAWAGIVLLVVNAVALLGADAFVLGLVGSSLWTGVAQLVQLSVDRAYRDTVALVGVQDASAAWQEVQAARRRERRERVQRALRIAAPVLTRVIDAGGMLTEDERVRAGLAEAALRDELRGAGLLDDDVRDAIAALRRDGSVVTVLDEGGLDDLPEEARAEVRAEVARTLRSAGAPRLIVRSAPDPATAVTVVGRSAAGAGSAEDDAVELWREIPRPAR